MPKNIVDITFRDTTLDDKNIICIFEYHEYANRNFVDEFSLIKSKNDKSTAIKLNPSELRCLYDSLTEFYSNLNAQ